MNTKNKYRLAVFVIIAGAVFAIALLIPAPSFSRRVEIINGIEDHVEVSCRPVGGWRERYVEIEKDQKAQLTYFMGDTRPEQNVAVTFKVQTRNGQIGHKVMHLPLDTNAAPITITKDWFMSNALPGQ